MTTADQIREAARDLDLAAEHLSRLAFHTIAKHLSQAACGLRCVALDPALNIEVASKATAQSSGMPDSMLDYRFNKSLRSPRTT